MQIGSVKSVPKQLSLQGLDMDSAYPSQENTKSEETGRKPTDNHSIGQAGESLVRYLLHMWKYDIYAPDNPSTSVDFAIKSGDEWATIQVKTTSMGNGVRLKREANSNHTRIRYEYSEYDFDYLFAVKFPKVYVVPFLEINKQSYVGLKDYEDFAYDLNDPFTYSHPPHLLGELNE